MHVFHKSVEVGEKIAAVGDNPARAVTFAMPAMIECPDVNVVLSQVACECIVAAAVLAKAVRYNS
jgi:hypothetical protein